VAEYFEHLEESLWALESCKRTNIPTAVSLCINPEGSIDGHTVGDCAVELARQGADIVGVNCHFDPMISLKSIEKMQVALKKANLNPYLMCQPIAFLTPDASKQGFIDLPEFPIALEPRVCTRAEIKQYAREAWKLGVRYIGGCCGFEPYHVRAMSEELQKERGGRLPPASSKSLDLSMHTKPWVRARSKSEYWENLTPATGRPHSSSFSNTQTAVAQDFVCEYSTDDDSSAVKVDYNAEVLVK
jgi:betaine-homocysteine S-methyltransferase